MSEMDRGKDTKTREDSGDEADRWVDGRMSEDEEGVRNEDRERNGKGSTAKPGIVPNIKVSSSYVHTMQGGLEETRSKSEEHKWKVVSWRTEETSQTCGADGPESKSEDIESWWNLWRDMMRQQELWKDVMAAVAVGRANPGKVAHVKRSWANWMGIEGEQV